MRILFTTTPGWGHIHPMVPLARALVDRGHDVLWATGEASAGRLAGDGFAASACGVGEQEGLGEFARLYPEVASMPPPERPEFMFPRLFGDVRAPPMLADLLPLARAWEPALMVCDAADLAGPIVAGSLGVPNVTHSFGALLPATRVAAAGERVAPLWQEQGLEPRPYAGCYDHLYLDIYPNRLRSWDTSHIAAVQSVRPVTYAGPAEEDLPELVTRRSGDPLVYVTFGTVFNKDLALVATVLEGLRDLGSPVRVVVTLGPTGDAEQLGPQPGNVCVARYIPQTQLLRRCAAVVSHAGSGTFLAALSLGLPQLCLPQAADQFLNAAACSRSGAGLSLQPGTVTADAVRQATDRLLSDPAIRSAAERLGAEIELMPAPAEVAEVLAVRFG